MFPKNFLWGASTAAHQVEGGNTNDWTIWEQANNQRLAGTAIDRLRRQSGYGFSDDHINQFREEIKNPTNYLSGVACDHYHRFKEDIELAKSLGHNAHRFSIEWSRVEPEPGVYDESAIDHYRDVIKELRSRGIEPIVTLWHWTLPVWFSKIGGFESKDSPAIFSKYVEYVVRRLGKDVKYWITLNEPNVYAGSAYFVGLFPPEKRSLYIFWKTLRNLIKSHRLSSGVIKHLSPDAQVGMAHHYILFQATRRDLITSMLIRIADFVWNSYVLNRTMGSCDFLGLNHYFCLRFNLWRQAKIAAPTSDLGWTLLPETIYYSIKSLQKYHKPIIITEHGCADDRDKHRGTFITESLQWLEKAINEGCDVRGYLHWSLLDNFEWDKGFWPRFGLIAVDHKSLRRTVRLSAYTYLKFIQQHDGYTKTPDRC
ncbi:MAG: glycoside hydrolase family 1 protein [Patescibacteria group bacterium]|jgi:beta-glucosidase